jgi:hypothetical protein
MKKLSLFLVVLVAFVITSCQTRIMDFTIVSTKNVDISQMGDFKKQSERIQGEDVMYIILFIPTKFQVSVDEAIDNALEQIPGAVALVDGVLYQESFYLFGGYNKIVVEGSPLVDPNYASNEEIGEYNVCRFDENGEVIEFTEVTKAEFESMK